MKKSYWIILTGLAVIAALSACSAFQSLTGAAMEENSASPDSFNQASDPAAMAIEQKLAIGTLKLEGTDQAVSVEQAKELLPLWQALKSLSTSDNTAADEINALYAQIEEALTPEQIQAIQGLSWTQEDLGALREQYGAGMGPGGSAEGRPTISADQRATRQAQFSASGSGGNGGAGGGPGGGMGGGMPPDGGMGGEMPPDGGMMPGGAEGTPQAGGAPSAAMLNRQAMGFNSLFADAVITLLKERANS